MLLVLVGSVLLGTVLATWPQGPFLQPPPSIGVDRPGMLLVIAPDALAALVRRSLRSSILIRAGLDLPGMPVTLPQANFTLCQQMCLANNACVACMLMGVPYTIASPHIRGLRSSRSLPHNAC